MTRTSDGFANDGMALVGMGGSVYTIKSAWMPAAAARMRSPALLNMSVAMAEVARGRSTIRQLCIQKERVVALL